MKQARIEWQGQVRDVLVNERDRCASDDGTVLKEGGIPLAAARQRHAVRAGAELRRPRQRAGI